jgi:hypothetical protein
MTGLLGTAASAAAVLVAIGMTHGDAAAAFAGEREPAGVASLQACRVVPGQALEKFYPVMPGWERGEPKSETDTQEQVSRTTVDFDRKTSTISVELMDSCRDPDVLRLMRDTLRQLPPATPGTLQRYTTVKGFPAYEEFTAESGHGEIHVLVADRFLVKVTADGSDLPTLQNAARLILLQELGALK